MRDIVEVRIDDPVEMLQNDLRRKSDIQEQIQATTRQFEALKRIIELSNEELSSKNVELYFPRILGASLESGISSATVLTRFLEIVNLNKTDHSRRHYELLNEVLRSPSLAAIFMECLTSGAKNEILSAWAREPERQRQIVEANLDRVVAQLESSYEFEHEELVVARSFLDSELTPVADFESRLEELTAREDEITESSAAASNRYESQIADFLSANGLPLRTFEECVELFRRRWNYDFDQEVVKNLLHHDQPSFVFYVRYLVGISELQNCDACRAAKETMDFPQWMDKVLFDHFENSRTEFLADLKTAMNNRWPFQLIPAHEQATVISLLLKTQGFDEEIKRLAFWKIALPISESSYSNRSHELAPILQAWSIEDAFVEWNARRRDEDGISPRTFTNFLASLNDDHTVAFFLRALRDKYANESGEATS